MPLIVKIKRSLLRIMGRVLPTDVFSHRYPVSVKGICLIDDRVILVKNERKEWDLPGGKLEKNEKVEQCLVREMREELDIPISVDKLLHAVMMRIMNTIDVLVVVYLCKTDASRKDAKLSHENFGLGYFSLKEIENLERFPEPYKVAVRRAFKYLEARP